MTTTEQRAEQRRRDIVDAAFKVFSQRGYHAAGIADIAAELQIGHGTFYRYFENKRDILVHVVNEAAARLMSVMAEDDPQRTNSLADYRAQTEHICARLFTLFAEDRALTRLLFVEALGADPEMTLMIQQIYRGMAAGTEKYLRNGVAKGFLRKGMDTEITAQALNGMMIACGMSLLSAEDPATERDRWIRAGMQIMFDGIVA
ncbi:DNA-binding transcriptional regulator, AcrR family [Amycolatopsis xylanica]|uniref:DNA-binding transcriptional regulator, AcrR family n=1 Tax=Amycolatopsis xylanica TaxID=589385 RepID=A0A1H3SR77_9PSEU|nr:TetR/AcrR family transcriptional regulator [Amycolatopsis xylanica]SDZ40207.1 DNA-binding transcriptional regulator, AcrR family [Amycolatopsis xylanica]